MSADGGTIPPRRRTPPAGVPILDDSAAVLSQQVAVWHSDNTAQHDQIDNRLERLDIAISGVKDCVSHLSEQLAVSGVRYEDCVRRVEVIEVEQAAIKAKVGVLQSQAASFLGARGAAGWIVATLIALGALAAKLLGH